MLCVRIFSGSILLISLLVGISAYSQENSDVSDPPLEDVWPALSEPRFGDLDVMIERGEIRVLTTFTLGSYYIDRGRQRGGVFLASKKLEDHAREKLGPDARQLKVTIIPVRRDQLLPYLNAGFGDVAFANLTITPDRLEAVDFSTPYYDEVREVLVTGPGLGDVQSLDDVMDHEIVVPKATSYFESISDHNDMLRRRALPQIKVTESDPRLEIEDILEMLNAGLLPMTVADDHRLRLWSQVFEGINVHEDIVFRRNGKSALAMRKDSPLLKELLDGFAYENRVGTLFTNMIINQYVEHTGWAKPALEREPFRRLQQLAGLFQTYGERYDFDWLLLASFAYQESGFDQDARSPVGAIGVMQVMPATAADRQVGIDDIHELENNVHAGTKYLAFLRGRYFSDAEMDLTERMLFTMAAYNAGPARINRLRKVAEERGLDPNIWFNNVELIVAANVGREPVDYVGNIYRYYIAYKRAMDALEGREEIVPSVR
ncbi:MAG: membrane-bound lytic murein transglycosylase MltF [Woeseiaceae bacterium]|jgi:membrane-bound lytic murein transglycosylase MltF